MRFLAPRGGLPVTSRENEAAPLFSPISISTSSAARLGYLFFDGLTFTLTLTGLSTLGGLVFVHADRAEA